MHHYFLKEDFDALNAEIIAAAEKIKGAGKEMGLSCQEGAETFHDNFAYEEGERQQLMWSSRLRELIRIRNQARVVEPQKSDIVSLGLTVTIEDEDTQEVRMMKIGSYMTFTKQVGIVSYNTPLARMLIGGKVGETKEAVIAGKRKSFRILKIE